MAKWLIKDGTLGATWFGRGLCPTGDGGTLKRKRCQTCFRLWEFRLVSGMKSPQDAVNKAL